MTDICQGVNIPLMKTKYLVIKSIDDSKKKRRVMEELVSLEKIKQYLLIEVRGVNLL